jgi:hypothetical protein
VEDVLRQVEDIPALEAMADRTYRHLIGSGAYTYRRFVGLVDGVIERRLSEGERDYGVASGARRARGWSVPEAHREGSTVTEFPTVYPLDSSHYFRREMDRLMASSATTLEGATIGHLTGELVRRIFVGLLGWRRGWIAARLRGDRSILAKLVVLVRASSAYPLRTLFLQGLVDRRVRQGLGYENLVSDLLKLEIVRQAGLGTLQTRERFFIRSTFDPTGGVLTLTSVPARRLSEENNRGQSMSDLSVALRRGAVTSIVWDHSALGWQIVLEWRRSQWVTVFVGVGGVHRFEALTELARSRPDRVAGVLAAIIGGEAAQKSSAPATSRG